MSFAPADGQKNNSPPGPARAEPSDEALLRRIAQRDGAAFELFFDRHSATINGVLIRIARDQRAAEELLQEVFLLVWRKAEQYDGRGPAAAWLGRVARNRAFDYRRRRGARPQVVDSDRPLDSREADTPDQPHQQRGGGL